MKKVKHFLSNSVDAINAYNFGMFTVTCPKSGKYRTIRIERDGEQVETIKLRIADHAHNPGNNRLNMGYFFSLVVCDKDATATKYNGYDHRFRTTDSIELVEVELVEYIKSICNELVR